MVKVLNEQQFADYARRQIHAALDILDRHDADQFGLCTCGRAQPCSVSAACQAAVTHFQAKLALAGATQPLRLVMREQAAAAASDRGK